jgi:hypothetical protein
MPLILPGSAPRIIRSPGLMVNPDWGKRVVDLNEAETLTIIQLRNAHCPACARERRGIHQTWMDHVGYGPWNWKTRKCGEVVHIHEGHLPEYWHDFLDPPDGSLPLLMASTVTYFTSSGAQTYNVPADYDATNNKVEGWGGSASPTAGSSAAGGPSGGYANKTNAAGTPGGTVGYTLGAGASTSATPGGDTLWPTSSSVLVAAGGGQSTTQVGTLTRVQTAGVTDSTGSGGNGGSGAPGPDGLGKAGGVATSSGGAGGGGSDGGSSTVGSNSSTTTGGNGGLNTLGQAGGAGAAANTLGNITTNPGAGNGGGGGTSGNGNGGGPDAKDTGGGGGAGAGSGGQGGGGSAPGGGNGTGNTSSIGVRGGIKVTYEPMIGGASFQRLRQAGANLYGQGMLLKESDHGRH